MKKFLTKIANWIVKSCASTAYNFPSYVPSVAISPNNTPKIKYFGEYADLGLPSGTKWLRYDWHTSSDNNVKGELISASTIQNTYSSISIPTEDQWNELINNCTIESGTTRLISFTSKINGEQIWFDASDITSNPYTQYYWTNDVKDTTATEWKAVKLYGWESSSTTVSIITRSDSCYMRLIKNN